MDLKPGEIECDQCNGSGNRAAFKELPDYRVYMNCIKCGGSGKIDWIENIVGKKDSEIWFSSQM